MKKCKRSLPNQTCPALFFSVRGAYQSILSIDHICKASAYNGSYEVVFVLQVQIQSVGGFGDP